VRPLQSRLAQFNEHFGLLRYFYILKLAKLCFSSDKTMNTPNSVLHSTPLLEKILKKPQLFEFFQAVRLINFLLSRPLPADKKMHSLQEVLRFKSVASFTFPVSDITQAKLSDPLGISKPLIELHTPFGGLYGAHGLLPFHYTELVMERLQAKDTSLRDFLDQFNQCLLSSLYQAWGKNHFYSGYEQAQLQGGSSDCFTHILNCLVGQGEIFPQQDQPISDESILFYSGFFANQRRSANKLQSMLADYFQIPIETAQFQGRWIWLAAKNRTVIGHGIQQNNQLGINTLLGMRVWDCQNHFRLRLGPLNYAQFQEFLPGEKKLKMLSHLTRRYVGMGLSFDLQLIIQADEVPPCQLGGKIRLAYDSWLNSENCDYAVEEVVLTAKG